MKFSQALNAMLRGHKVALRSEPGVWYTFDGAENLCIWAYIEESDDLVHIDNVDFERMMAKDWYVLPKERYGYQESTRKWTALNHVLTDRFSYIDTIGISALTVLLIDPARYWHVGLLGMIAGLIGSLLARKWRTNV